MFLFDPKGFLLIWSYMSCEEPLSFVIFKSSRRKRLNISLNEINRNLGNFSHHFFTALPKPSFIVGVLNNACYDTRESGLKEDEKKNFV